VIFVTAPDHASHKPQGTAPLPALDAPTLTGVVPNATSAPTLQAAGSQPTAAPERPGVPGYEILDVLGRGGMGVVYRARQLGLNRLVALKMILAGSHAGPEELARFRTEAEAVAQLQHPHIVQIYEIGEHQGLPYFSLELVNGGSLAQHLNGAPLPASPAAALVRVLAQAVHAAHQHGIIHRDLKPANVLLQIADCRLQIDKPEKLPSEQSAIGNLQSAIPKITDFGLAKRLDAEQGQTRSGAIVGTPSYMAPEQAGGKTREIGPGVDIYALGAILYELLSGRPPFRAESPLDTVLQVISEDPVPPRRLQPRVPPDLETICLKCLQKDSRRRYSDAATLAEDLRRFAEGEPILARPTGAWERGWKLAKRRPALATLAVVSLAAVVCLLAGGVYYNARVQQALTDAELQRQAAVEANSDATAQKHAAVAANQEAGRLRTAAQQTRADAERQRQRAEDLDRTTRRNLYFMQFAAARRAFDDAQVGQAIDYLQGLRPARPGDSDFRGFEWYYLWSQCHAELLTLRGHGSQVWALAISPDGKLLASGSNDGSIKLWDPSTGREIHTLRGHTGLIRKVVFRPDGQRLASASADRTARIWNVATGQEEIAFRGHTDELWSVAYSPDKQQLVSVGNDKMVRIWDAASAREVRSFPAHEATICEVCFSPDGKRLATAAEDMRLKLWDAATGKELRTFSGHTGHVRAVVFHPKGTQLASASLDGTARIWDAASGQELRSLRNHTGPVYSVAYSRDGTRLATGGNDRTARVWDAASGQEQLVLRGHTGLVWPLAFTPDGQRLATGGSDQTIKLWDVYHALEARTLAGHTAVAFSPDGRQLAAPSGGVVAPWPRVFNATTGEVVRTIGGHQAEVIGVAYSRDGKRLASCSAGYEVRLWDAATGAPLLNLRGPPLANCWSVAFSPDGTLLATGGMDQVIRIWDVTQSTAARRTAGPPITEPQRTLVGHRRANRPQPMTVVFSPNGRQFASAGADAQVGLWDVATGKNLTFLGGHRDGVLGVAFSPDGKTVASASADATIKLWDVERGTELRTLIGHKGGVWAVAFDRDGRRLASVGGNSGEAGEVKIWDPDTGLELLALHGHTAPVTSVAFSPDGERLATATISPVPLVKLWGQSLADYPDTHDWRVVFEDKFQRAELGPAWQAAKGRWSLAMGTLLAEPLHGGFGQEPIAALSLKKELPNTCEVQVDCWSEQALNCALSFGNARTQFGVGAVLSSQALPIRGAGFPLIHGGSWTNYIGRNSSVTLQPGQHYRLRVLRAGGRLALFLDYVEIATAPFPSCEDPDLTLVAFQCGTQSTIHFANFVIRAPEAAIRERALRSRVEHWFDELLARSAVVEHLRAEATLSEADRTLALQIVEEFQEDSELLSKASWGAVKKADLKPAAYALALKQAEAAWRLTNVVTALAVAQYRLGRYQEALANLLELDKRHREAHGCSSPIALAFLALVHHRLGHADEARAYQVRLRDLLRNAAWNQDADARQFLREVNEQLGDPAARAEVRAVDAVKEAVLRAEEDGWLRHDLAGFLRLRAEDDHEVDGRAEQPDKYDVVLNRAQLEALRRIQFRYAPYPDVRTTNEDMRAEIQGDQAVLRWDGTVQNGDWFKTWRTVGHLRKTIQGWKLFSCRSWPIAERTAHGVVPLDAAYWKALDAGVEKARAAHDLHKLVRALQTANRRPEAYQAACELTSASKVSAEDWVLRSETALDAGHAEDAVESLHRAQQSDVEVGVPYYASRVVRQFRAGAGWALGVSYHRDGKRLATSWQDGTVHVYNVETGAEMQSFRAHAGAATDVVYSPDGRWLATAGGTETLVRLWDASTARERHVFGGHTQWITRLQFSPDSKQLVSCSRDGTARVWDVVTGQPVATLLGHGSDVMGAAFSPEGRRLASCGGDGIIRFWDLQRMSELFTLTGHTATVDRVAFSPDGKRLVSCGLDTTIKIWDLATRQPIRELSGHVAGVECVLFSPDGRFVASASQDGNIKYWDAESGRKLLSLRGHEGPVFFVALSADGTRLVSSSTDGSVRVWDVSFEPSRMAPR
jgi:WD40 repeat protein